MGLTIAPSLKVALMERAVPWVSCSTSCTYTLFLPCLLASQGRKKLCPPPEASQLALSAHYHLPSFYISAIIS